MKRSRDDDVFESSLGKRPVISSRAEPSGQAQVSTASSAQRLTTHDALSYLKNVKEIFKDNRDKYDEFLDVMKNFKAQRINTSGVISRVKELFEGHLDLILGFNTFLPKGYEITIAPEDEPYLKKKPVDFEEAISFVNKIKTRFDGDDRVYKAFLDILNMYRKDNKSITEVYQEVSVLFQDHADLLVEFTHFLPDASGAASIHYSQSARNHLVGGDDRGSPMTTTRPNHIEKKPGVSYSLRDQNVGHPNTEQWNHAEKEKGKKEDRDNTEWEHDDTSGHKRKSVRRDDSLTDQSYQGMQELVSAICEKVKERIKDPESHKKFSDCVRSYESKFVTTPQFRMLVASLLGTHPDLMEECEDLITYVEKTGCLQNNKQFSRSLKAEDRDGDDHDGQDRDKNRDRERDRYGRGLAFNAKDVSGQKMPLYASKEKFMAKPIQELDLSNCESCTPSYRLLPENYPIPSASRRTDIGVKVLNDHWVSVTSGSEDYSFKHMRKNQYEESLFRCEDDRFELDMLLESVKATAKRVEDLLSSMNAQADKIDSSYRIEDHLTALNLRCIERLYGDHGLDVMDVLKKNAPLALPVILARLTQKQEEWVRCRADFNKVWAEIYAKNYHKSLDHRSFYFKQQDTKNLSAKALLAEIKELSENNQNEDEIILSVGAGYRQPIRPHMQFEYPDPNTQEDLYQLMQFSCGEICTLEQHDKVMKIWTSFLETVLGVPSRPPIMKHGEDVKANDHITRIVVDIGEGNGSPAGEAASVNHKPSSMPDGGNEIILTEQSCSSRVRMENGNDGVVNDTYPDVGYVACRSEILCVVSQTGVVQTDASMIPAMIGASNHAGCLEEGTASAAGEMGINEENTSDQQKGRGGGYAGCEIVGMPTEEPQDGVRINPTTSSMGMELQEVKTQECHEETETGTKSQREIGESSPTRSLEQTNIAAVGNSVAEAGQHLCENAVSTRGTGAQERSVEEVGGETDAIADDEGEESAPGSLDSENASENGEASASESADGEECSPEEPDEDGDHDGKNNKAESEGEAEGPGEAHDTEGVMPCSDRLQRMKPLIMNIPMALRGKEKNSQIFYGNDSFYLLFRLHQMLYERMQSAKLHSSSPENRWRASNGANPTDSYARFKDALHSLLNGSSDNAKFEDDCRAIIGAQSYVLFTLDKLMHKLVKQLQTIATEEVDNRLLQLYAYEKIRSPETFSDAVYHENARFLLPEDNLYRIECFSCPTRLTIQLMNNEHDKPEGTAVSMDPNFASYLNDDLLAVFPERKEKPGVYLKRNKRRVLTGDELSYTCKVMEGLINYNGLEIKVAAKTFKAAYVLDTEDFLYRPKSRRTILHVTGSSNGASNGASYGTSNGFSHRAKRRKLMFS